MTANNYENPQRVQSREMFAQALLDLMKEKPYSEITITDLSIKADLARRTFYRHFTTIDDILDYTLHQLSATYRQQQKRNITNDLTHITFSFFSYWEQHKDFLQILEKNNLLYRLHSQFAITEPEENTSDDETAALIEYAVCFTSGAMWNLLVKWLQDGAKETPSEMATVVKSIILHLSNANK